MHNHSKYRSVFHCSTAEMCHLFPDRSSLSQPDTAAAVFPSSSDNRSFQVLQYPSADHSNNWYWSHRLLFPRCRNSPTWQTALRSWFSVCPLYRFAWLCLLLKHAEQSWWYILQADDHQTSEWWSFHPHPGNSRSDFQKPHRFFWSESDISQLPRSEPDEPNADLRRHRWTESHLSDPHILCCSLRGSASLLQMQTVDCLPLFLHKARSACQKQTHHPPSHAATLHPESLRYPGNTRCQSQDTDKLCPGSIRLNNKDEELLSDSPVFQAVMQGTAWLRLKTADTEHFRSAEMPSYFRSETQTRYLPYFRPLPKHRDCRGRYSFSGTARTACNLPLC